LGFQNINHFISGNDSKFKYDADCHEHNVQIAYRDNVFNVFLPAGPSVKI